MKYKILTLVIIGATFFLNASSAHAAPITGKSPALQYQQNLGITSGNSLTGAQLLKDPYNCVLVVITLDPENPDITFTYPEENPLPFLVPKNPTFTTQNYRGGLTVKIPEAYSCPRKTVENTAATEEVSDALSFIENPVSWVLEYVLGTINDIFTWLFDGLVSNIFVTLLSLNVFINSDIVRGGWPFVQGFANLGFIFALLYIALATTLRIDSVAVSIQRLLPKLLIGALLVNFSLIIGGLVIDVSRLVMAVEVKLIVGPEGSTSTVLDEILNKSKTYESTAIALLNKGPTKNGAFTKILESIKKTVVLAVITIGLLVISINMFVRYVVLLILLIFSPLAYLALALPQTSWMFKQWWQMFLKWVLYGPIVLFFLILITKINSIPLPVNDERLPIFAQFCVVVALLYIGNGISKKIAGAGSDTVMNWAKKNPRTALLAGSALTGVLPAALLALGGEKAARMTGRGLGYLGKGAYNNVTDFKRDVTSGFAKKVRSEELFGAAGEGEKSIRTMLNKTAKVIAGVERNDKGEPKAGQRSAGNKLADTITYLQSAAAKQAQNRMKDIMNMPEETRATALAFEQTNPNSPIHSSKLLDKKIAVTLPKEQIAELAKNGTTTQIKAMISHKDVVRSMDKKTRNDLYMSDNNQISKAMETRMRDLANEK